MDIISHEDAIEIVRKKGISYIADLDNISYLIQENEFLACWKSEDVLIILSKTMNDIVNVIPLSKRFDIDELMGFVETHCKMPTLLIPFQDLESDFAKELDESIGKSFAADKTFTDFAMVFKKDYVRIDDPNIRLVTKMNKNEFVQMTSEKIEHRPDLALLFDIFVVKKQGEILAAFEGDKIVGYISFMKMTNDYYDVDYIYTSPEYRRKGYGARLAYGYLSYVLSMGCNAYWSNAKNMASMRIATKCGFSIVRIMKRYIPLKTN